MIKTFLTCSLLLVLGMSSACHRKPAPVIVEIGVLNASPNDMWIEVQWTGPSVPVGILPKDATASSLMCAWPELPRVVLDLTDDKTKQHYRVTVDLAKVNEQVRAKPCKEVLFRVLAYDQVDVTCK